MAKFTNIDPKDMHNFLVERGFVFLNLRSARPEWMAPESVLPFIPVDLNHPQYPTFEMTYGKRVYLQGSDKQLTLRVYTSLTLRGGTREKGSDAIRVLLFWREVELQGNKEVGLPAVPVGGEKRVHRVEGWRKNLGERLAKWRDELMGPECPKCGRPMIEREGRDGKFWGCTGWRKDKPLCSHTIPIGGKTTPPASSGGPPCSCGARMVKRSGARGAFLGCSTYPVCKNTRDLPAAA